VNHVQAPQQQRHAAHQVEKNHTSHEFPLPDLSRKFKLSPNHSGSMIYFVASVQNCHDGCRDRPLAANVFAATPDQFGGCSTECLRSDLSRRPRNE
jgi:hypothetical protein